MPFVAKCKSCFRMFPRVALYVKTKEGGIRQSREGDKKCYCFSCLSKKEV